jgi:hypothetical protein
MEGNPNINHYVGLENVYCIKSMHMEDAIHICLSSLQNYYIELYLMKSLPPLHSLNQCHLDA